MRKQVAPEYENPSALFCPTTSIGYSAYAPDLPGCIATGKTIDEVRTRMREAIEFHIEGLQLEALPIPAPTSKAFFFDLGKKGSVKSERRFETLYDIKTFANKMGISPSTARVYAHRYKIGQKMGRGWVFTDADFEALSRRHALAI
ncbi:MAG: type II toxin-antitoxin system HicB family antitoxin [Rectinemataceae bacterium]|nr:type II toxin-antitoxin system HicB family antitoxin [Rectinemataceae bacterium]